jgi:hypothetical protein
VLKKRGKFFRYKVSSIVKNKCQGWDNLSKKERHEYKKTNLNLLLNPIIENRNNNNQNYEMNDVSRRNIINIERSP